MSNRLNVSLALTASLACAWSATSAGVTHAQSSEKTAAGKYKTTRTPDGPPALSGWWQNNDATPFQRPKELEGRATLTDAEVAALKKRAADLFNGETDAAFGDEVFLAALRD